jgi:hypothetical protein
MKKNYLMDDNEDSIEKYCNVSSYLSYEDSYNSQSNYFLLPEEYDIFSNLGFDKIIATLNEKYPLAIQVLISFKTHLQQIVMNKGVFCILPKLIYSNTDENTISFNLVNSTFRIFFSFDSVDTGGMAYCGLVVQEDAISMLTQSKIVNKENCDYIVDLVLNTMLENS